ncbi:hypothetical protein C8F04DRAFT_1113831, partial [Mycena alexandri]
AVVYFFSRLFTSAAPAEVTLLVPPQFGGSDSSRDRDYPGCRCTGPNEGLDEDAILDGSTIAAITVEVCTLIAAADYASYTLAGDVPGADITLGFDGSIQDGAAVCNGLDDNSQPATVTASSLQPLVVDVIAITALCGNFAAPSGNSGTSSGRPLKTPARPPPPPLARQLASRALRGSCPLQYSAL